MNASLQKAQDVIYCDLCETTPVQMHCNLCATNLCKGCVGEHISADPTKDHNVVLFNMRNTTPILPRCKIHRDQNCEMHCRQCAKPICVKCITSGSHKQHDVTDLMKLCDAQKKIIEKKTKELEQSIYPKYEIEITETENQISNLPENLEKLMTSITDQGSEWHREVDAVINRLKTEAMKMKSDSLESLQKHLSELKNYLSQVHQAILDNKNLLQSNNVTKIMVYNDKAQTFDPLLTKTDASPAFSSIQIQSEDVGSLTTSSLLDALSHIKLTHFTPTMPRKQSLLTSSKLCRDIDFGFGDSLWDVVCHGDEEVWVCGFGSHEIKHFNTQGIQDKTVTTNIGYLPESITLTNQGHLIYIGGECIFIVRNAKHEKMITTQDFKIRRLCYTARGDLLVSMFKDMKTPKKVVRFRDFKEKQVIQFDQKGKPWFSTGSDYSIFIDENENGDICASDNEAKQVLVINRAGELRFRYTGTISYKKAASFCPRGIVTDSEGHILIADKDNNCIHIISDVGHLLHYIDNCQLSQPFALSLDKNNVLFVSELNTRKVRVIKYLK